MFVLLVGTVSPQQLADSDSCFATIDGVSIHYKERVTDPSPVPVASGSTSSTNDEDSSGMRGASGLPAGIRVDAVTGTFTLPQQHLQHTDEGVCMASTSGRTPMLLMHGFNGSTFNW